MISFSRRRFLHDFSTYYTNVTTRCRSNGEKLFMGVSKSGDTNLAGTLLNVRNSNVTSTTTTSTSATNLLQHRHLSSSSSSSSSPHNRIAGRKRFYKIVGVGKVESPATQLLQLGKKSSAGSADEAQQRERNAVLWELLIPRRYTSTKGTTTTTTTTPLNGYNKDDITDWYTVTLDTKPLRTPAGLRLAVPSLPLAVAIAAEWDSQQTILRPVQMPLMTSVCTALDQTLPNRTPIIHKCMSFLYNDTTCYFTDPKEDRVLYQRQKKYWHKLHDYIAAHVVTSTAISSSTTTTTHSPSARPALATATSYSTDTTNLFGNLPHPEELVSFCNNYLRQLDVWHLTALHSIATETKSLLIALAALDDGFSDMDDINYVINAGRVEEEFQIENWGLVEGGHDYDRLNASITIGAARVMLDMIRK